MDGTKEGGKAAFPIVAALALVLGGPASAVADGPLDAGALQTVQQQAAAVVAPTAQRAGTIVQDATGLVTPVVAPKPAPKRRADSAPATAAHVDGAPGNAASGHIAVTGPRLALAETAPGGAKADNPGSPPHGHEVMPAARSRPGRARLASPHSKLAADTSAARGPSVDQAASGPPLAHWKPSNPLLGLGRPVGNPAVPIQVGWLLTMIVAGCIGGRTLLRRSRTD